jgi:hypothetical protein
MLTSSFALSSKPIDRGAVLLGLLSILVFISILRPTPSRAEPVEIEWIASFDPTRLEIEALDLSPHLTGRLRRELPSIQVAAREGDIDLSVSVERPVVDINYRLRAGQRFATIGLDQFLESNQLNGTVLIPRVAAKGFIERRVAGAHLRLRVEAVCEGLRVELLPSRLKLQLQLGVGVAKGLPTVFFRWGELSTDVSNSSGEGSWRLVDPGVCRGPSSDMIEQIRQGLLRDLNSAERLQQLNIELRALLVEMSSEYTKKVQADFLSSRRADDLISPWIGERQVDMQPTAIGLNSTNGRANGWIRGWVRLSPKGPAAVGVRRAARQHPLPELRPPTTPWRLALPKASVTDLLAQLWSGEETGSLTGDEISAFRNLHESAIQSWFVWPEIRRYPSAGHFRFSLRPELRRLPVWVSPESPRSGLVPSRLELSVGLQVQQTVGPARFFDWAATLEGRALLMAGERGEIRARFEQLGFKLAGEWSKTYQAQNSHISVSTFESALREKLAAPEGLEIVAPFKFRSGPESSVQLISVGQSSSLLVLDGEITP